MDVINNEDDTGLQTWNQEKLFLKLWVLNHPVDSNNPRYSYQSIKTISTKWYQLLYNPISTIARIKCFLGSAWIFPAKQAQTMLFNKRNLLGIIDTAWNKSLLDEQSKPLTIVTVQKQVAAGKYWTVQQWFPFCKTKTI